MKKALIGAAIVIAALLIAVPALASRKTQQTSSCIANGKHYSCKTGMRLTCHKPPGSTILKHIPRAVFWMGTWHITLSDGLIAGGSGPVVKHGRLTFKTPYSRPKIEVIATYSDGKQVLIKTRCTK